MKIQSYEHFMLPFIAQAEDDGDAICNVFFSREEGSFRGTFIGMTADDALSVLKELADHFKLDAKTIIKHLNGK